MLVGNNLFLAGFGFWIFLFPTAFFGYLEYVSNVSEVDTNSLFIYQFFYI